MDLNTRKERFSLAYVNAVATYANCEVLEPRVDRGSVDGILKRATIEEIIGFQAKATSRDVIGRDGRQLRFPLPVRDYDNLRNMTRPFILIVVLLPDDEAQWLTQTDAELCLRHCAYWLSLEGTPKVANSGSVTVHIPTTNIFSSSQLADLMDSVYRTYSARSGGWPSAKPTGSLPRRLASRKKWLNISSSPLVELICSPVSLDQYMT